MIRILLKTLLFLVVLIIIALFIALDNVDYTPYFESEYYQATKEGLEKETAQLQLSYGQVNVGLAKVNITPVASPGLPFSAESVPMAGYGKREGQPARGVHDSLYIKAMALKIQDQVQVIVSADMLIVPPNIAVEVQQVLTQQTDIKRNQIIYTATHTHSSLGGWSDKFVGKAFAGEPNPEIVKWLAGKFATAIERSITDLRPAQIGYGSFEAPNLVLNRIVGDLGQEHATCTFVIANQHQGKKAIVGIFDAHATTLSDDNWDYSADYPAYWYQKMEQAGFDFPLFCAGGVGSHGPEVKGKGFERAKTLGEALADSMLRHIPLAHLNDSISFASINLKIHLPKYQVRLSEGFKLAPFLCKRLFPPIGEVYLQSTRIGEFIWTATPADYSGELAIGHQNDLYKKGFQSTLTSFNGAYIGYVLPAKYYFFNDYESRTMSWFGPGIGPYLDEMIYRMNGYLVQLKY